MPLLGTPRVAADRRRVRPVSSQPPSSRFRPCLDVLFRAACPGRDIRAPDGHDPTGSPARTIVLPDSDRRAGPRNTTLVLHGALGKGRTGRGRGGERATIRRASDRVAWRGEGRRSRRSQMSASLVVTGLVRLALVVLVAAATTLMPAADAGAQALVVGANFVVKSLDPARTVETTSNMVNHSVYDSLVTFDGEDLTTPKPSLATDWTVSPDGKTYTFRLRRNVRFASGNPLTSADVKWSLDRVRYRQEQPRLLPELRRGRPRPGSLHRGPQAQGAEPVAAADPVELQPGRDRQQARQPEGGRRQPGREGQGQGGAVPAGPVRRHRRVRHGALRPRPGDRAGPEPEPLARRAQGRAHRDPQHHGAGRPEAPARARATSTSPPGSTRTRCGRSATRPASPPRRVRPPRPSTS